MHQSLDRLVYLLRHVIVFQDHNSREMQQQQGGSVDQSGYASDPVNREQGDWNTGTYLCDVLMEKCMTVGLIGIRCFALYESCPQLYRTCT